MGLFDTFASADDTTFDNSGGDFGPGSLSPTGFAGNKQPPVTQPHNSGFVTGLNLLLSDPSQFFNQLTGGNPADIPPAELTKVATKPVSDNVPKIPTLVKVSAIVGVGVLALLAVSLTIHEIRNI